MRDIIGGINQSSIEGMNKITYTKHCEFCGTEFTTPIHLRRYCSKSCVRAVYKMRLKEKLKSDAVREKPWAHARGLLFQRGTDRINLGPVPDVCLSDDIRRAPVGHETVIQGHKNQSRRH